MKLHVSLLRLLTHLNAGATIAVAAWLVSDPVIRVSQVAPGPVVAVQGIQR